MSNRKTAFTPLLVGTDFLNLTEGGTATPDMSKMTSQFRRSMIVDEIRFIYVAPVDTGINMGGLIRCKLKLGRYEMTNTRDGGGYVPIWNFGPAIHSAKLSEACQSGPVGADAGSFTTGHFRWKLPKPLFVPAGQQILPQFYRVRDGFGGTAKVSMSIVGRQFGDIREQGPKMIDVPYVAFYEPEAGVTSAVSMSLDLANPFQVPLYTQRFIGRQFQIDTVAGDCGEGSILNSTVLESADTANIQIRDSWGNNIVRDVVDFGSVIDPLRRSWTFTRILNPKERYVVNLQNIVVSSATKYAQPHISIVGWRQEINQ